MAKVQVPIQGYFFLIVGLFVGGALFAGTSYLVVESLRTGGPFDLSSGRDIAQACIGIGFSTIIIGIGVGASLRVIRNREAGDSFLLTKIAQIAIPVLLSGALFGFWAGSDIAKQQKARKAELVQFEIERLEREAASRAEDKARAKAMRERFKLDEE